MKTGLGRRIAFLLVKAFRRSTLGLGYALTLSDAVIAPATPSNTARAGGILFPVVRPLASSMGSEPGPTANRIGSYLMFNEFQTTVITSAIFLTGVAPNSMIVRLAKETFKVDVTWMSWFWAALVPGIISLAVLPYVIYKLFNPEVKSSPAAPCWPGRRGMTAHATAFFVPLGLVAVAMGAPAPLVVMVLGFMNSLNAAMTHCGTGPAPIYFGAWWKVIGLW